MIKNVYWSSYQVSLFLSDFNNTRIFMTDFRKMHTVPFGRTDTQTDGQTDTHDRANSRCLRFC